MDSAVQDTGAAHQSISGRRIHSFPKERRMRRRREFLAVQRTGQKFHGRHFLVVIAPRNTSIDGPIDEEARYAQSTPVQGGGRVGITASKKVGNAVVRNRIKRFVRECMRRNSWVPDGADAVIIAKRSAATIRRYDVAAEDLTRIGSRIASC